MKVKTKKIIFVILTGIRTTEKENNEIYNKFSSTIEKYYEDTEIKPVIHKSYYGYISLFANIIPYLRKLLIKTLASELFNLNKQVDENTKIVIVSFSYGTWLTSHILQNYTFNINSWVLFGGVEHCKFDFTKLKSNVKEVLNFCSTKDNVAKTAPWLFDYGNCGAWGFRHMGKLKADYKSGTEIAWYNTSKNPLVTNFHFNSQTHHSWFKASTFILLMLQNISK